VLPEALAEGLPRKEEEELIKQKEKPSCFETTRHKIMERSHKARKLLRLTTPF
jgi:hypothetical protein